MRRGALLLVVGAALAAPAPPARAQDRVVELSAAEEKAFAKAQPHLEEAQRAFRDREFDAAANAYRQAIAALDGHAALGGWRDQAAYNLACAHARAGRPGPAADAFAESVRDGLRAPLARTPAGAWVETSGLTLEHVLADSDLDTIRGEQVYRRALAPYLEAGEPVVEFTRPERSSRAPAVVVLAAEGEDAARALPAWKVAAGDRALALVAIDGPVRPAPRERRWILGDGDERWAVAKVKRALDLVAKDPRIDEERVFLVGQGARPGEAAWAAALAERARLAGFAAPGARFHAEFHEDAIAALPAAWRVALAKPDARAAALLAARGLKPAVLEPTPDPARTAAAILAAFLDPR